MSVRSTAAVDQRAGRRLIEPGHPLLAGALLLVIYVGLSLLCDSGGFLGTDTGGKVATVKVMAEHRNFDPDVGYWAAKWDPDGLVHGLSYTTAIGSRFVNVTSLPMILAAQPLWRLGGYRATLLLPMLGSIASAFAARALVKRLGGGNGHTAFWIIGLAGPLSIYALDLWEHSLGVAFMAWGIVALLDAYERGAAFRRGVLAGAAFGAAAAMRTEAYVYCFTSFAIVGVLLLLAQKWRAAVAVGAGGFVGMIALFLTNAGLEIAVIGTTFRGGRVAQAAGGAGQDAALRAREAMVTLLAPEPSSENATVLFGVLLLAAVAGFAWFADHSGGRNRQRAAVMGAVALALVLYRLYEGPAFVPGLFAATPIAGAGLVLGRSKATSRLTIAFATIPLPLVFYFQFPGGALPQWGGRYVLLSGFLLSVVAIANFPAVDVGVRRILIGVSVAMTALGFVFVVQRTHGVADAGRQLAARPEPVMFSPNGFVAREFGSTYGEKNWLSSGGPEGFKKAVDTIHDSGFTTFALVELQATKPPPTIPGFHSAGSDVVEFVGPAHLRVTTFIRDGT